MNLKKKAYDLGILAEDLVLHKYQELGFKLLAKRKKYMYVGEIDLIVQKDSLIVFIEVKARRLVHLNFPIISKKQQNRIYQTANYFIAENPCFNEFSCRIDLAIFQGGKISIIENFLN